MDAIPVNEPLLDGNERRYVTECIDAGWISAEGRFVAKSEENFASRVGRNHGIAVGPRRWECKTRAGRCALRLGK